MKKLSIAAAILVAVFLAAIRRPDVGATLVAVAMAFKQDTAATLLLKAGANPNALFDKRPPMTLLQMAVVHGNASLCLALLERGMPLEGRNERGTTALWAAVQGNQTELVELLLSKGADPNSKMDSGEPLLCSAYLLGKGRMPELLLSRGAQADSVCMVKLKDKEQLAPRPLISVAADHDSWQFVRELLNANANPNAADGSGWTALDFAVRAKSPKVVELLLAGGANANVADEQGFTPLMYAVHQADAETIDLLGRAGADAAAVAKDGTTAIGEASKMGQASLLDKLNGLLRAQAAARLPAAAPGH